MGDTIGLDIDNDRGITMEKEHNDRTRPFSGGSRLESMGCDEEYWWDGWEGLLLLLLSLLINEENRRR